MQIILSIVACLATFAAAVPKALPSDVPILSYDELNDYCKDAGPNAYVGVVYADRTITSYDYGQCYPYALPDGAIAVQAVFCKSITCYSYQYSNCTGGVFPPNPLGVPIPAGTTLINVANFVTLIGQGALCYQNSLPGIEK